MKALKVSLCAAIASFAVAGAASAAEWSFNAGAATDYVFRGVDQTPLSNGAVFGGADVSGGSLYAGTWVSTTGASALAGDNAFEYDIYAGWKPTVGSVNLDLGLVFYGYTDSTSGFTSSAANTLEFKAAASVPVGGSTLGGAVYYTDDDAGSSLSAFYYEVNLAHTYSNDVAISAALGVKDVDTVGDYTTWNVGVTVPVTETFSFDARYVGTDSAAGFFGFDGLVATVKATF